MKKIVLFIVILLVQSQLQAQNQEKITTDFTIYQVGLWLKGSSETISGVLFSVDDSTLTISNSSRKYDYANGDYTTTVYQLDQILEVTSKRLRGGGIGAVIGLVGGGVTGAVIGKKKKFFLGKYRTPYRKATKYAAIGGAIGGTLGLIIGRKGIRGVPTPDSKVLRKLKARAIKKN